MRQNHLPTNILTAKQMASAMHMSISTVYRRVSRHAHPYYIEDIFILRQRGLTMRNIEFILGVPRSTIHRILQGHNA